LRPAARTDAAADLRRSRRLAVGLLCAVTALYVLARWQHLEGPWAWLGAFAEAAMVGALADWFAVVALFRHPLGLPIPHTAILPRNKDRVADSLARFIRDRFLGHESLLQRLRQLQPADRLATWLEQPDHAQWLGDKLVQLLASGLELVDDQRVRQVLAEIGHRQLAQLDLGRLSARLLTLLTRSGRHQIVLNHGLAQLAQWLDEPEVQLALADLLIEVADKEYPRTLKALGLVANTGEYSQRITLSLVRGAQGWLAKVAADPEHPRRAWLDQTLASTIERLQTDTDWRTTLAEHQRTLLADPHTHAWLQGLWDALKARLQRDLAQPDSALHQHLMAATRALGQALSQRPQLRAALQEHLERGALAVVDDLREGITQHIASTVRGWDEHELVRSVELQIGSDLQFIRLNGTLVGGCIGLLLHAADLAWAAAAH